MLKLIFGESIFNRHRKNVNFWFRQNYFGCFYMFILFPPIFSLMLWATGKMDLKNKKVEMENPTLILFFFLLFIVTYKIIVSISRYHKKEIPIWKYKESRKEPGTPWHGLNIAFFFLSTAPIGKLTGYEKLTDQELILHRRQQSAKILYHLVLLVIILGA